jgi:transposase
MAADRSGVHVSTVERWRSRFVSRGILGLEDEPRPGHRPKFKSVERLELIALACDPVVPPEAKRRTVDKLVAQADQDGKAGYTLEELKAEAAKGHRTTRTIEELVAEAVRRGLVEGISWSSYQRLLADADIKPHKVEQWVHSPDPQFKEKVTSLCDLYLSPAAGSVVLCIDEKTGMQAIERRFPDRPAAPGRHRRREFEYKRHGTQSLLCAFEVHTGHAVAACGATRTGADLVCFMEQIAVSYPKGVVHVVWDCLNIHFDGKDGRWTAFNQRHGNRFVFHYTPKHASWVNQVECFFSIVQRQCLTNCSFPSTEALRDSVLAFIDHWNHHKAHPFRWTFTGYPLQSGVKLDRAA